MALTFSPKLSLTPPFFHRHKLPSESRHYLSYNDPSVESGYGTLSHPMEDIDDGSMALDSVQAQTTPRTSAAISCISSLQLSTPRDQRELRKGKATPLKRNRQAHISETTPKKLKSHDNIENESGHFSEAPQSTRKQLAFRSRLDRSFSLPISPSPVDGGQNLDCTFDAISSSTPISQPFRADFYEKHTEEITAKYLPRSGGKGTRTKLIRKMQSFSPGKLGCLRMALKEPLREMNQNSKGFLNFSGTTNLCPVAEESPADLRVAFKGQSPSPSLADSTGSSCPVELQELMYGNIKMEPRTTEQRQGTEEVVMLETETSGHQSARLSDTSHLLDIYITNLSNLDGGELNSSSISLPQNPDVVMNSSVSDVHKYFDELKRNTTHSQDAFDRTGNDCKESLLLPRDSVDLVDATALTRPPPRFGQKRKRSSTELIQSAVATPKKLRRSQSFHVAEDVFHKSAISMDVASPQTTSVQESLRTSPSHSLRLGARKKLNYAQMGSFDTSVKRLAPSPRRSLNGTTRLNIFRHLSSCSYVFDHFFEFVTDKDLVAIYAVSRQCRNMILDHPKLNSRRLGYLETAGRRKENHTSLVVMGTAATSISCQSNETIGAEQLQITRRPLNNRNVDTSGSCSDAASPPVSPSRRKFHENQKVCHLLNTSLEFLP